MATYSYCIHCERVIKGVRSRIKECPFKECDGSWGDIFPWKQIAEANNYTLTPKHGDYYAMYS